MNMDMFSTLSHEFKMPLTILTSNIDVLEKYYNQGILDKLDFPQYMGTMRKNCDKLIRMVNNFIDFAYTGEYDNGLACSCVDFSEMMREVVDNLYANKSFNDIEFTIDVQEDLPKIDCDIEKIERVFLNLISNSYKYAGSKAKISVKAQDGGESVKIRFADNGPGIPKGYEEEIFNPFVRLDEHKQRAIEGTGLGLAIVRKILRQHGGDISLDTKAKGCVFDIVLPYEAKDSHCMRQDVNRYSTLRRAIEVELSDCCG